MTATLRATSAFLVLLLFASCRDAVRPEPKDLVGLWVMEEECMPVLQKLGFAALTNRTDHMILLNENGTCAYRALDAPYQKREFWEKCYFGDTEDNMLEYYPKGVTWYDWNGYDWNGKAKLSLTKDIEKSWYLLDIPLGVFDGPYSSTNMPLTSSTAGFHVNRWTRWKFVPKGKYSKEGDYWSFDFTQCPCHVQLLNGISRGNWRETVLHVETDDKGLYLWLPTYQNYDYYGPEQIKFRKSDSLPRPTP